MVMSDWKALEDTEDLAHFRAELVDMSPGEFHPRGEVTDPQGHVADIFCNREQDTRRLRKARRGDPGAARRLARQFQLQGPQGYRRRRRED